MASGREKDWVRGSLYGGEKKSWLAEKKKGKKRRIEKDTGATVRQGGGGCYSKENGTVHTNQYYAQGGNPTFLENTEKGHDPRGFPLFDYGKGISGGPG